MEKIEVLTKCQSKELSPKQAYRELYGIGKERKPKRAHFVKVSIRINESPGLSVFLGILLALPIPVGIAKMFLRKKKNEVISDTFPITYGSLMNDLLIKGILIDIKAKDETRIHVKTL